MKMKTEDEMWSVVLARKFVGMLKAFPDWMAEADRSALDIEVFFMVRENWERDAGVPITPREAPGLRDQKV